MPRVVESYRSALEWGGMCTVHTQHHGKITLPGDDVLVTELGLILTPPGRGRMFLPHGEYTAIEHAPAAGQ